MSAKSGEIFDISVLIRPEMPSFPGDPGIVFESALDMGCGGVANVTLVKMGSQTGTHFDTPHHILNNGKTSETLPLEVCYGPARVIEIPETVQAIDQSVLKSCGDLSSVERLLLKTRNSGFWQSHPELFRQDFAALTPDGARYLADLGVKLVGIDYLSIELFGSPDLGAHKALLTQNIVILEGINLTDIEPGYYTLIALPLKYHGLDGAPTRAVLVR